MGCRCGCATYREHISSLHFRPTKPGVKQTVDHTDQTVNTVTEHWDDRVDVHIQQEGLRTHG